MSEEKWNATAYFRNHSYIHIYASNYILMTTATFISLTCSPDNIICSLKVWIISGMKTRTHLEFLRDLGEKSISVSERQTRTALAGHRIFGRTATMENTRLREKSRIYFNFIRKQLTLTRLRLEVLSTTLLQHFLKYYILINYL